MSDSIFFELKLIGPLAKFTAFQRELLGMTLEANPGVMLGAALQDVFDYLEIKPKKGQLEAIGERLVRDHQKQAEPQTDKPQQNLPQAANKSDFGESLIKWINEMHSSDRLLVATGFDIDRARRIYCEEDYAYTDRVCKLFLEQSWQGSLVQLQAASAPWMGGKGNGNRGQPDEYFDMSQAADDDPQWKELAGCFGGGV